ncbi:hypothetical protein [Streptomyces sp. DH37]|uniref:hypothetical protein n=1 Tax=Streptomyces sp. DH37 TaxID=3040122 RepID=UPI002443608D|nr:hypothetical protein [Streptomyces sp. DH37]MDG9703308.1 hypothetical protein [Streptomyces sp. DH37]
MRELTAAVRWPDEESPWIRPVVPETCPRHRFAPGRVRIWDGEAYRAVERDAEPER